MTLFRLAVVVTSLSLAGTASAQMLQDGPPPADRLLYRNLTAFRVNPLQLLSDFRMTYRHRLYRSESRALTDNFAGLGLSFGVTPACTTEGIHLELAPASVFQVYGSFDLWQWFGNFNFTQSFRNAEDSWGPNELARRGALPEGAPTRPYASTGMTVTTGAILQGQLAGFSARHHTRVIWASYQLRDGDRFLYDPVTDLLAPNNGWSLLSDTDITYAFGRLMVGLRFSLGRALYAQSVLTQGVGDPNGLQTKLGPTVSWRFYKEPTHRFNPTVSVLVNWFLSHRYRTGLEVTQALPQIIAVVTFWGDALDVPAPATR